MRAVLALMVPPLAATLLAGCSAEPASDAAPSPVGEKRQEAAIAPSGPPSGNPRPGSGSGLTAKVSALNSAISGLNMRVTDYGTVIDLPADALFEFDRADLTPGATSQLTKSAQVIRDAPAGPIRIVGHTDSKGDDAYNQKLSEARAHAVAAWFGQQVGVRQRRFEVIGMGEKEPVAPNQTSEGHDDAAGRTKNRRVEVILPPPA